MSQTLLLVDASSSIYRAFYALPPFSNSKGEPTHATLGFTTMLQKVLRDAAPDYVVIVWDAPGKKRRKELYADYKATRDATPDDLRAQIPRIREIVDAMQLTSMEYEGEEADDVIATLVCQAVQQKIDVEIVSTDKDLMQLVSERVTLLDTMKDRRIGPAEVEERFGVPPDKVLDLRALVGDSSDNIPGVRGIGEKTATKLIHQFGDLDSLLEGSSRISAQGQREKVQAGVEQARLSRELSRLREDLPLEFDRQASLLGDPDSHALSALFRELEFRRLLEELDPGSAVSKIAPVESEIASTPAQLHKLVKALQSEARVELGVWLEPAEPMRGDLVALALGSGKITPTLVPVTRLGEGEVIDLLRPLFERDDCEWVGFDLKDAVIALMRRGVELRGPLVDVGLAAYLADSSQQLKPEFLARAYLGRELPSFEDTFGKGAKRRNIDEVPAADLASFSASRLLGARELCPAILEQLGERDYGALHSELEAPLIYVLARMEVCGVRIDESGLQALSDEFRVDLGVLEQEIYELAGEEFKINSPKQLQHILFEKLRLPPGKRTKTGLSTDESVLEELSDRHELPGKLLDFRRLSKLASTYVDALPRLVHSETRRIHCQFNQTVAATGRLSAANPNLQNIPIRTPAGQRIRAMFVPAEDHVLVSADYSQVELRILAHLSQDDTLVDAFRNGEDIHVRTASDVFGIAPDEVSDEQRSRTKAINFGIIYGSSAFGLARQLGIAQNEAAEHIRAYFERYPGVRAFLDQAVEIARERGFSETLLGRRRYLPDLRARNRVVRAAAERMATNSVIQGTAADLIKRAMIQIDADLAHQDAPDARMILQVHDELLFEVPADQVDALADRVLRRMQAVPELSVPLEVHLGSGGNWLEAH